MYDFKQLRPNSYANGLSLFVKIMNKRSNDVLVCHSIEEDVR